jgi:hypothetical protein
MSLWADTGTPGGAFASVRKGPEHLDAVRQVKEWTRSRFALADDETILVAETARTTPGFPPLETAVTFWTADGTRHHFKVFKPVIGVRNDDVPPAWLKESLALAEGMECECC